MASDENNIIVNEEFCKSTNHLFTYESNGALNVKIFKLHLPLLDKQK